MTVPLKIRVLNVIAEHDEPEIFPSDIAKRLKIPYAQVYRLVKELHREGRLYCDPENCDWCFMEARRR